MSSTVIIFIIMACIKEGSAPIPGTFYWKPRLGIDLAIPTTESMMAVHLPTAQHIREGLVVLIEGYQAGITVIAIAAGLTSGSTYPHLNPISAYFYTNVYRWGLRYLSMLPMWLSGSSTHFCKTHKVWKRRFYYMDEFVPKWMRYIFPYVRKNDWEQEQIDFRRFKKYSEPAFGKHFRYPTKRFNNFKSEETKETVENAMVSKTSDSV